ncbi:fasciclin domain-containing protein [Parvularcula maris]|uniref:Fasciclin domain-containing protein n=1 Tax=Parvularcula maris TaxID=2965077 RepID=A0A9X2L968_9PROT|nr:fasciclin domain-containing protein [Parvularcula maris]MCQ8185233.1 fasciclin domain-containing protein [Parvularcula maris]
MPLIRPLGLGAALLLLAACGGEPEAPGDAATEASDEVTEDAAQTAADEEATLLSLIEEEPRFSVLREVLEAADLLSTFENQGPLTLFAPSNDAFAALPAGYSVEVLSAPENRELLKQILAYHVVSGRLPASDIVGKSGTADTLAGSGLSYDGTGTVPTIGTAPGEAVVTIPDLEASNGVIHVIDKVLLPPA